MQGVQPSVAARLAESRLYAPPSCDQPGPRGHNRGSGRMVGLSHRGIPPYGPLYRCLRHESHRTVHSGRSPSRVSIDRAQCPVSPSWHARVFSSDLTPTE